MSPDFRDLLSAFNAHGVEYLVVGACRQQVKIIRGPSGKSFVRAAIVDTGPLVALIVRGDPQLR